jgi:hypothetical protein
MNRTNTVEASIQAVWPTSTTGAAVSEWLVFRNVRRNELRKGDEFLALSEKTFARHR